MIVPLLHNEKDSAAAAAEAASRRYYGSRFAMFKYKSKSMGPVLKRDPDLTGSEARRVRDLIMMRSRTLLLGRCCLCPKGCYRPHNVRSVYCTCGLLAVCSLLVLVGIWTGAATWYFYSKEFLPTICTPSENVTTSRDLSARVCSCRAPPTTSTLVPDRTNSSSSRVFCRSAIPCIQVWVKYNLPGGTEVETLLHETVEDIKSNWQCSHLPRVCSWNPRENAALMADFRRQWGDPQRPFPCYHHPSRSRDVVRLAGPHPGSRHLAVHGLLWPAVCSLVFFVGMLVPMLICGCQYVWGNRVPAGIMDARHGDQTIPLEGGGDTTGQANSSSV